MPIEVKVSLVMFRGGAWVASSPELKAMLEDPWAPSPLSIKEGSEVVCVHTPTDKKYMVTRFYPSLFVFQDWDAVAKLDRCFKDTEQFAAIASHDMTEPLRQIQYFSQKALTLNPDTPMREALESITRSSQRLNALVSNLLTYSRIQNEGQSFMDVDLLTVIKHVVRQERTLYNFEIKIDQLNIPVVFGDPIQLEELIRNIISNAIKFQNPDSTCLIEVTGAQTESNFILTVQDNGIGLDPKYRHLLFQPFKRLVGRSQFQGTGLGLAICHRIMERHGGSIHAESEGLEKGTKIIMKFPRLPKEAR